MWPGFPIQKSTDRSLVASSPWHIAGSHVFHRLLTPRHPPHALSSLITSTSNRSSMSQKDDMPSRPKNRTMTQRDDIPVVPIGLMRNRSEKPSGHSHSCEFHCYSFLLTNSDISTCQRASAPTLKRSVVHTSKCCCVLSRFSLRAEVFSPDVLVSGQNRSARNGSRNISTVQGLSSGPSQFFAPVGTKLPGVKRILRQRPLNRLVFRDFQG